MSRGRWSDGSSRSASQELRRAKSGEEREISGEEGCVFML